MGGVEVEAGKLGWRNSKQYRISKHSTPKHRKSDLSPSESDRLKSELSMFGAVISKRYGWELHIGVDFSVFSAGLAPLQRGPSMSGAVIYTRYGWELHIRDICSMFSADWPH